MAARRSRGRCFKGAFVLVVTLAASHALAQQPPPPPGVPATGEPPPVAARGQEEAEIVRQAREAYAQSHHDELRHEAERQVEAERRAAWERRGRENIPPAFTTRLPRPTFDVLGSAGSAATKGWQIGLTGAIDMRIGRYWGLHAAGTYLTGKCM